MTKPSEEYTIRVLSDEEYNNLPYPQAKTSFGMSIMDKKTAYIRQTNVREMDMGTIRHEFDELMQSVSPHEENGIRYKGGRGFFSFLLPALAAFIPVIGPALSIGLGAAMTSRKTMPERILPSGWTAN